MTNTLAWSKSKTLQNGIYTKCPSQLLSPGTDISPSPSLSLFFLFGTNFFIPEETNSMFLVNPCRDILCSYKQIQTIYF